MHVGIRKIFTDNVFRIADNIVKMRHNSTTEIIESSSTALKILSRRGTSKFHSFYSFDGRVE